MKLIVNFLILFLFSQSALSLFGTGDGIKATNVCTYCAVDMQMLLNYDSRYKIPNGSSSVLVIQQLGSMIDVSESSVVNKLQNRVLHFAKSDSSFSKTVVEKAREQAVTFKLYYQLAIDPTGKTSIFSGREKPTYEQEKEIAHELWGYYQIIDSKPYVLINEYQNFWNADYTVVHELAHLYDLVSADYIEKFKTSGATWHALDDIALEFRAVLAEVQYRKEVKSSKDFSLEKLLKTDFRDELMSKNEVSNQYILNYVLDLLFPISFKQQTTLQLASARSEHAQMQKILIYDVVNEFFQSFFEKLKTQPYLAQILGLTFNTVSSDQLAAINRQSRAELLTEAQRRGASSIMDYLAKNKLTLLLDASTVRKDGGFNQLPHKSGGPSPRTGGGSP